MTNEQIRVELSSIAMSLTDLPDDDFATRAELRDRRLALRNEVAKRPMTPDDATSLRRELVGLKKRLAEILDDRPNIAAMSDGGEGQRGMAENQKLGWDYDEGTGRNGIEERILYIESRLADA